MTRKAHLKVVPESERSTEIQKAPAGAMSPFDEIERLFEHLLPRGWPRPFAWERPLWSELSHRFELKAPRIDVIDRDAEIVIRAEIAGVDKKDIDISVTDNTVTIKGKASHEERDEKGDYYRCEIARGAFSRTIGLPALVDGTKAKASFKDGMLELSLPKLEKSKRHSVTVE